MAVGEEWKNNSPSDRVSEPSGRNWLCERSLAFVCLRALYLKRQNRRNENTKNSKMIPAAILPPMIASNLLSDDESLQKIEFVQYGCGGKVLFEAHLPRFEVGYGCERFVATLVWTEIMVVEFVLVIVTTDSDV